MNFRKWEAAPKDSGVEDDENEDIKAEGLICCPSEDQLGKLFLQPTSRTGLKVVQKLWFYSGDPRIISPTTWGG